jgi:hypothetical protein
MDAWYPHYHDNKKYARCLASIIIIVIIIMAIPMMMCYVFECVC